MIYGKRKPLAFISTSLRDEDRLFEKLIQEITRDNGFEPMGTVGRHSASPIPVWEHIVENIQSTDCVIVAATPRYLQQDIRDKSTTKKGISEIVHAEAIAATILKKPVLVFVLEGTDIGSLLPQITQYIIIRENDNDYLECKRPLIKSYFKNTLKIIQENWGGKNALVPIRRIPIPKRFQILPFSSLNKHEKIGILAISYYLKVSQTKR